MNKWVKVLIGLAVVSVLAGVMAISVVSADTPTPQNTQKTFYSRFVEKLASALGKTPQETQNAITQAQKDLVNEALQQGKITQQQADKANKRIENGGLGFGPGRFGFGPKGFGKAGHPRFGYGVKGYNLKGVASFLGITPADLKKELINGKSLAQVAQEHGKTRDQLKDVIVSNAKDALNKAVANGKLTQEKADNALKKLRDNLDNLIDRAFQAKSNRLGNNQPKS